MKYVLGIFLILHAMVHLLYAGQSARFFELKPGMVWPDAAWAFSRFLGNVTIRNLASLSLLLSAIIFIISGVGILSNQPWAKSLTIGAITFSSIVFILFWNGQLQDLDGQGGIGLIINIVLLVAVLLLY